MAYQADQFQQGAAPEAGKQVFVVEVFLDSSRNPFRLDVETYEKHTRNFLHAAEAAIAEHNGVMRVN